MDHKDNIFSAKIMYIETNYVHWIPRQIGSGPVQSAPDNSGSILPMDLINRTVRFRLNSEDDSIVPPSSTSSS